MERRPQTTTRPVHPCTMHGSLNHFRKDIALLASWRENTFPRQVPLSIHSVSSGHNFDCLFHIENCTTYVEILWEFYSYTVVYTAITVCMCVYIIMIALVGFAATANFKTPGKPQISKSGAWLITVLKYMHILLWHRYTCFLQARGSISSRTYMYTYTICALSRSILQIFFSLFGLLWSPHLLHGLWSQTFKGKKGSKAAPVGVSQKGMFLWFMKIDVWADSIRTTVSSARVLAPVTLEGFWARKRCRKSISSVVSLFLVVSGLLKRGG